jgi:hypothetical protein
MNVMIALPPEIESRLRGAALRCGLDVGTYAAKLIVEHVPAADEADGDGSNPDVRPLRGFFPIPTSQKSVFTQPMTANLDELPRWKPRIDVTRRVLSEVDDA